MHGIYSDKQRLPNSGNTYEKLFKAMVQISSHLRANSDIKLQSGMFYFKFNQDDEPVFLFPMMLKADRPTMVLNGSIPMTFSLRYGAQAALKMARTTISNNQQQPKIVSLGKIDSLEQKSEQQPTI